MYGSSTGVLSPNNQGRKRRPFAPEDDEETMLSIIAYLSSPSKPKSLLMYSRQLPAFKKIFSGRGERKRVYFGKIIIFLRGCVPINQKGFPREKKKNPFF